MRRLGVGVLMLAATASGASAATAPVRRFHEMQDNRATLVLRDALHVSVTLYINYLAALHRAMAPRRALTDFVLTYSAMPARQFAVEFAGAQKRLLAATSLQLADGTALALTHWTVPDAARVQALLQQQAMQAVVTPGAPLHEEPLELHADAVGTRAIRTLRVRFPAAFGKVLVVSYQPKQVWADPKAPPVTVKF